jgi:hypothetical protein
MLVLLAKQHQWWLVQRHPLALIPAPWPLCSLLIDGTAG